MKTRDPLHNETLKNSPQNGAERGLKMKKMTKQIMIETLASKGVKIDKKMKVADVAGIFASKSKVLAMGNRTGEWYFGTKRGTWAGQVAEGIALGLITSKSDIRKLVTKKYGFTQTLGRLELEGLIRFTSKSNFEMTTKGHEVAAMYKSRFAV